MRFVFDEVKRTANLKRHGLDMADFEDGFECDGVVRTSARPSRTGRLRFGWLAAERGVVSIMSPLGSEALSRLSLGLASQTEKDLYGFR